jgi:hypothetical protein
VSYHPQQVLSAATDRDFERELLPFLHIVWPTMTQPNPKGHWDRLGIDLFTEPTDEPITCCVQCKGFVVQHLGAQQYRQILSSIKKFQESRIHCNSYLIIHNRDARLPKYEQVVSASLSDLVASGQARKAAIYDRRKFLKWIVEFVEALLRRKIRSSSRSSLAALVRLYGNHSWQLNVPIAVETLAFRRDMPAEITSSTGYSRRQIQSSLFSQQNTRWAMVTGQFGVGKTTATLLAAHHTKRTVIRAECARFLPHQLGGGMNALTKEIARSIGMEPPTESCRKQFEYFSGRQLSRILKNPHNDYALVIDGLDENRHYGRLRGLFDLTSQLAEVRCPILLVTRRAHFEECFGDMSTAFYHFSDRNGPKREAMVIDLGFWTGAEVREFLENNTANQSGNAKARLEKLIALFDAGEIELFYGTLPFHPLFLSFILDEVMSSGISKTNRCKLIESWVVRKILRDRNVGRVTVDEQLDGMKLVTKMLAVMEMAALAMISERDGKVVLNESISEDHLNTIGQRIFATKGDLILAILLNSIFVSSRHRAVGETFSIMFSHRVLQEYFLARGLVRDRLLAENFPNTVRSFYEEITESSCHAT